jgi:glycosyltransferase Alg8
MLGHALYILVMLTLALAVPHSMVVAASGSLLTLGLIGLWRYSWAAFNITRAAFYLRFAFPALRRRATRVYNERRRIDHAYFLVTTYKIAPEISARVYRSIFEAACNSPGGATIVASIVDDADARLIQHLYEIARRNHPAARSAVSLKIDKIAGTGKRDALARSLRSIAGLNPGRNDIVLLVDGDSCVPPNVVERSLPFFTDPKVGAITTDERSETKGGRLFRDWFELRFAQRHVMMSSMSLSGRVLTLTGRMSIFRASLATDSSFVEQVRNDFIDHWRLGRVQFLTGDDKSTWFWLLRRGYKMLYIPDLCTLSIETQPHSGFAHSAVVLMMRWFGNMLRTNGRALDLPVSRIGFFTKWSILDQVVSIWTTIAGPLSIILSAIFVTAWVLPFYVAWVLLTRYLYCSVIMSFRGRSFPVTYPILLYSSQIGGALIKSYVLFRLDRQKWTRQSSSSSRNSGARRWNSKAVGSVAMHVLTVGWLALSVAYVSGVI